MGEAALDQLGSDSRQRPGPVGLVRSRLVRDSAFPTSSPVALPLGPCGAMHRSCVAAYARTALCRTSLMCEEGGSLSLTVGVARALGMPVVREAPQDLDLALALHRPVCVRAEAGYTCGKSLVNQAQWVSELQSCTL